MESNTSNVPTSDLMKRLNVTTCIDSYFLTLPSMSDFIKHLLDENSDSKRFNGDEQSKVEEDHAIPVRPRLTIPKYLCCDDTESDGYFTRSPHKHEYFFCCYSYNDLGFVKPKTSLHGNLDHSNDEGRIARFLGPEDDEAVYDDHDQQYTSILDFINHLLDENYDSEQFNGDEQSKAEGNDAIPVLPRLTIPQYHCHDTKSDEDVYHDDDDDEQIVYVGRATAA